jgi:hypothetical protein
MTEWSVDDVMALRPCDPWTREPIGVVCVGRGVGVVGGAGSSGSGSAGSGGSADSCGGAGSGSAGSGGGAQAPDRGLPRSDHRGHGRNDVNPRPNPSLVYSPHEDRHCY